MISIIVSSYKKNLYEQFVSNVTKTIGDIPYEIIQIWNPGLMGICEAYNKGGQRAQYKYLVFAHEDILFHTQNWGSMVYNIFEEDKKIGLIGVMGAFSKSLYCSGWAIPMDKNMSSFMIGTNDNHSTFSRCRDGVATTINLDQSRIIPQAIFEKEIYSEEVALLDGMLLITTKEIFGKIKFDELLFKDFHCYDLDYSLQIRDQDYKVVVTHNILIEHLSFGSFNEQWLKNSIILHEKWNHILPIFKNNNNKSNAIVEFLALETLMRIVKGNTGFFSTCILPLYKITYVKKIGLRSWLTINLLFLKKIINQFL